MKSIWISLVAGYVVLLVAIVVNALVTVLGIKTWYGFFREPSIGIVDGVFLFGLYPLSLGLAGMLGVWLGQRSWKF